VASFHRYPQIRDILGLFGFRGDDVCKHIKVLSGGEKARIALVKILISSANFLIMDEPLNHLDMVSKQALELALTEYEGTLMLISHDRYFLDKIVNRVVEIRDGMCETYQGNYSYYMEKRDLSEVKIEKTEPASRSETSKKQRKKSEAEQRQKISTKRNRLNQEIQEYEKQIESLEKRRQEIELTMSQPETYEDSEVIIRLQKELAEIKKNLTILYHNWELAETSLTALLDGIKTNKADTSSSTKKINSEKTSGRGCPDQ
jgi:ATP-binding cassette subfamily F protein 3